MGFPEDFAEIVGPRLHGLGFLRARACEDPRMASYVRRETDEIGVYVLAHDARPAGGDVDCEYLVGPLDIPDDRVRDYWVGIRAVLYSGFEFDDGIAAGVAARVATLDAARAPFVERASSELAGPAISSVRLALLVSAMQLLEDIAARPQLHSEWTDALELLRRTSRGELSDVDAMKNTIARPVSHLLAALAKQKGGLRGLDRSVAKDLLAERAIMLTVGDSSRGDPSSPRVFPLKGGRRSP